MVRSNRSWWNLLPLGSKRGILIVFMTLDEDSSLASYWWMSSVIGLIDLLLSGEFSHILCFSLSLHCFVFVCYISFKSESPSSNLCAFDRENSLLYYSTIKHVSSLVIAWDICFITHIHFDGIFGVKNPLSKVYQNPKTKKHTPLKKKPNTRFFRKKKT